MNTSPVSTPAIRIDAVSKRYVFQAYQPSLRHEASQIVSRWLRRTPQAAWEKKPFWSLRNVSFTLNQGDSLGVIGHNGAGKTTLLRVLSGIVEPTEGTVSVQGRFATLIGLGAGFDYERSGRENIYLNAAIQGVAPREVNRVIDQITDFAELGDFIDRPVKLYSSGMIARLGFSVAFFTLPEVVFLDEILSVGDLEFQTKSMQRILELKQRRCTLVYVSHNLASVQMLCERAIWLDHGQIVMDGVTADVIAAYRARQTASASSSA